MRIDKNIFMSQLYFTRTNNVYECIIKLVQLFVYLTTIRINVL